MGPPLFSGGNLKVVADETGIQFASMGPPLFSGGNVARGDRDVRETQRFNGAAAVQRRK